MKWFVHTAYKAILDKMSIHVQDVIVIVAKYDIFYLISREKKYIKVYGITYIFLNIRN